LKQNNIPGCNITYSSDMQLLSWTWVFRENQYWIACKI